MNNQSQRRTFVILFVLLALTVLTPVGMWLRSRDLAAQAEVLADATRSSTLPATGRAVDRRLAVVPTFASSRVGTGSTAGPARTPSALGIRIRELLRGIDPAVARPGELVIVFESAAGYLGFLSGAADSALPVSGRIPELAAVWLVPGATPSDDTIEFIARALEPFAAGIADLGSNRNMFLTLPSRYEETQAPLAVPSPAFLGLSGQAMGTDNLGGRRTAAWGRDFMIALLDTGVAPAVVNERSLRGRDPALLGVLDAGWGNEPVDLHGSGAAATLGWITPGARILGVRVTDADGVSDVFSVAQGIVNAVNVGANLIAVSPASPEPALILNRAVGLVVERGLTVVASTGGDAGTWPAADPRTIAVGSILTRRTGLADDPVATPQITLDQTPLDSAASAVIVAGALADVMSVYPGTKAADAWASLQYMTNEASAGRSALAAEFYASGLQVLNLSWVGMQLNVPPVRGTAGNPGNVAAGGGARGGRAGAAANPGRVLIGPQPGGRRGADIRGGGGGAGPNAGPGTGPNDARNTTRVVPVTQPDRTVRGNTVPIGQASRAGSR